MLDRYLAQLHKSPNTKLAIRRDVGAFLSFCDPLTATSEDVRYFLERDAEKGLSQTALHERYRALQDFFSWLLAERLIPKNPMRGVREPETKGNLKEILGLRDQAITALLEEGLTSTILASLKVGCLHRDNKLRMAGEETLTLSPETAKALRKYIHVRHRLHPRSNILFVNQLGEPLTDRSIRRAGRPG
jgi:site-specific recombinase XerD